MAKTKSATTAKTASRKPAAAAAPAKASAAGKAAGKPVKVELVTLRQLATSIGEAHGISTKQANEVLA
ncbi:MAG: HU family DNA-binding protein, partial [Rhodomicrobium sp.]